MQLCAYCALRPGSDREHVIPRVFLRMIADAVPPLERPRQRIVRACRTCNGIAGTNVFPSFEAKRAWIRAELERRGIEYGVLPGEPDRPSRRPLRERPSPARALARPVRQPALPYGDHSLPLLQAVADAAASRDGGARSGDVADQLGNRNVRSVAARLRGLHNAGYVAQSATSQGSLVWTLTRAGRDALDAIKAFKPTAGVGA